MADATIFFVLGNIPVLGTPKNLMRCFATKNISNVLLVLKTMSNREEGKVIIH